ncbi:MAG: Trk system potassium transporter TrkA [Rhodobacteraceae bacterium]|nr:Trk system potassium transporter TrkA [Paracoccaceae bacterium]
MRVLVLGAGQVGRQICGFLVREDDLTLTVLDSSSENIIATMDQHGVSGVVGEATNPADLEKASIRSTDLLIAATASDDSNVIACYLASQLNERIRSIARLRNLNYQQPMLRESGGFIDVVINPETEVAKASLQLLTAHDIFYRGHFLNNRVQIVGIRLGDESNVLNTPLRQLSSTFLGLKAVVVAVRRQDHLRTALPDDEMHAGDQIYIVIAADHLERTMEIFGIHHKQLGQPVIIGGGRVGVDVARQFEAQPGVPPARIIEADPDRAQYAADRLGKTIVMQGDGLNPDILAEANLASADAVMALTNDDKTNLLALMQARRVNPDVTTIGIVNDPWFADLDSVISIDTIINPQVITVASILPHIRSRFITQVQIIGNGAAEVAEINIDESSQLSGKTIRNANLPDGVLVGAIAKGDDIIEVTPDVRIESGDSLVISMEGATIKTMARFLEPHGSTG